MAGTADDDGGPSGPRGRIMSLTSASNADTTVHSQVPDALDLKLLQALQLDGRAPFNRIADVLGVSDRPPLPPAAHDGAVAGARHHR
ncbi:AsnC family protein [Streptomyces griseus]|uniref:AsnC family protein n=1 Tax=Streptomyces griseus TaxID=1911 RepID=UPI002D21DBB1|nr:AsnC family protein [Streptomyces griseus]